MSGFREGRDTPGDLARAMYDAYVKRATPAQLLKLAEAERLRAAEEAEYERLKQKLGK